MNKKIFNKFSIIALAVMFSLGLAGSVAIAALAPGAIDLGSSDNFAVLSGSGVVDTNPSSVTGDVGASPITGAAIAIPAAEVTGTIYSVDGAGTGDVMNPGLLTLAKTDLDTAYNLVGAALPDIATDLAAQILTAGTYHAASGTFEITGGGTLTLDGQNDPNSVFIFKTDTTLVTSAASSVVLINGAQACNVFWQVGSSATLGTGSDFIGTIMAVASITDNGDSTVLGRLLADADNDNDGAVTLNNTTVTVPTCAPSLTLQKTVDNTNGGSALNTDWTLTATGALGVPTNLSGTNPVNSDVTFDDATFQADTYTLAENGGPSDYEASTYSCVTNGGGAVVSNTITLSPDDDAVCTITNTYVSSSGGSSSGSRRSNDSVSSVSETSPATLYVVKQVVNNNGGLRTPSYFNLYVTKDGFNVLGSPATGVAAPGIYYSLTPSTYKVSEYPNAGYTTTLSGDCDSNGNVVLSSGDNKTCTVINDDVIAFTPTTPFVPMLPKTGFAPQPNLISSILDFLSLFSIKY